MKKITKASLAMVATAAVASSIAPATVLAEGDNSASGSRPSYTIAQINNGDLGDKITFNSISDSVYGDEKNFVAAIEKGSTASTWNANEISIKDGTEYVVRLYVHNNNPNGTSAIAKDVTTSFGIPTTSGKSQKVTGYITSSNATPTKYWDSVVFKSDHNFHLEYVLGSARWQNNGVGAGGEGVQLSDNVITTTGAKVGYSSLNGEIPGCYTYDGVVTIRVKAVYDYEFVTETRVSINGGDFEESVHANEGDIVEYAIKYQNTSDAVQKNVIVKDVLAENMEYINGSTYLYNSNHKDGLLMTDDTITSGGINIGNYDPKGNAYVVFKAKVVNKSLVCGTNKLGNWGQVGVSNTTLQDSASVFVSRTCSTPSDEPTKKDDAETTKTMPKTGPASTVAGILGLGGITTAVAYFVASRKKLTK